MTRYNNTKQGFQQEVTSDGATFTATVTNVVTGASKVSGGWKSYQVALWEVRDMWTAAVQESRK